MKIPFLVCAIIVALFACAILIINPALADILYDEDGFFENLTVGVCSIALALSLALFFIKCRGRSGYGFWLFFSLLVLIFIGDEISWGMKYFGFTKHRIAGVGFDGVHDILSIGIGSIKLIRDYIMSIGILDIRSIAVLIGITIIAISAVYFLIKLIIKNRERIQRFFSKNLKWKPFLFLFIGLALILIAMIIDDDNLVGFPHKAVVEESLELIAAVSFLFTSLSGFRERKKCTI